MSAGPRGARGHAAVIGAIWLVLTLAGLAAVAALPILPELASLEGRASDEAFTALLYASVPVFVLVEVVVLYSALRFRRGPDGDDGPAIETSRPLEIGWVAATSALVLALVAVGVVGMQRMGLHGGAHAQPDVRVVVVGSQFAWRFEYPDLGLVTEELKLPVGRHVRFEITSRDVLHSFWVPVFRVKQDAVPGRSIAIAATPTETGRFEAPCAELCGVGHTIMHAPVEVMSPAAFDAWVADRRKAASR